jgi:TetR/AcrR family transcriptional regulator, copper-responsive repressor
MKNVSAKPRGRPPAFERGKALHAAMHQFWAKGYEATSLADLSSAMKLNPPSIYGAFGDKRSLFDEAVQAYQDGPGCFAQKALEEESDPRKAIERLLMEAAANFTRRDQPPGCMVVLSALNCADTTVSQNLSKRRNLGALAIVRRVQDAAEQGRLPNGMSPSVMANLVVTVFQGMSIQARDGATREELEAVAHHSMMLWPPT